MSATTPTPVAEPTTVDHLDFDPCCEITVVDISCGSPGIWFLVAAVHCTPDMTKNVILCQEHFDQILGGAEVRCEECRQPYVCKPRIIRTERIR